MLLVYVGYAGTVSLYRICELMMLQESRCCDSGSDSWPVPRRILLLCEDPIICVVPVIRVPCNLFLGSDGCFGVIKCDVCVHMHIVVNLPVLVSLGRKLVELAGVICPKS